MLRSKKIWKHHFLMSIIQYFCLSNKDGLNLSLHEVFTDVAVGRYILHHKFVLMKFFWWISKKNIFNLMSQFSCFFHVAQYIVFVYLLICYSQLRGVQNRLHHQIVCWQWVSPMGVFRCSSKAFFINLYIIFLIWYYM